MNGINWTNQKKGNDFKLEILHDEGIDAYRINKNEIKYIAQFKRIKILLKKRILNTLHTYYHNIQDTLEYLYHMEDTQMK